MTNSIAKNRNTAFQRQNGHCCYCGFKMWQKSPAEFAKAHGISAAQARHFQCTAEHLQARQDGGTDRLGNIAAACLRCNNLRHARAKPPQPPEYQELVQKRLSKGKWHSLPIDCGIKRTKPPKIKFEVEHQQARA